VQLIFDLKVMQDTLCDISSFLHRYCCRGI